jgi:tetratricopeptide (TPR) repeat protein
MLAVLFSLSVHAQQSTDSLSQERITTIYKKMLAKNPHNAVANLGMSDISYSNKNFAKAYEYAETALDAGADSVSGAWLLYVRSLDAAGRTDKAIKECIKALYKFSKDAPLWAEYGFLSFKMRDYEVAIDASNRSLTYQPLNPDACVVLSLCLYERSNHPQAALPLLFALACDNRPQMVDRMVWLFLQMVKQKHANISIPYFDKRLALISSDQILRSMYSEQQLNINFEHFEDADFRITAGTFIHSLTKGETSSLQFMSDFFLKMQSDNQLNTSLFVMLSTLNDDSVNLWLKTHRDEIKNYGSWLEKNLPLAAK